jgi:hypothetical protein
MRAYLLAVAGLCVSLTAAHAKSDCALMQKLAQEHANSMAGSCRLRGPCGAGCEGGERGLWRQDKGASDRDVDGVTAACR